MAEYQKMLPKEKADKDCISLVIQTREKWIKSMEKWAENEEEIMNSVLLTNCDGNPIPRQLEDQWLQRDKTWQEFVGPLYDDEDEETDTEANNSESD